MINSSFLQATNNTPSCWRSLCNLYKYLTMSDSNGISLFLRLPIHLLWCLLTNSLSLSDSLSSKSQGMQKDGYQETLGNSEHNQWTVSVTRNSWTCSIVFPFERSNEEYCTRCVSGKTNSVIRDFQFQMYNSITVHWKCGPSEQTKMTGSAESDERNEWACHYLLLHNEDIPANSNKVSSHRTPSS